MPAPRTFTARHVQLTRAALAAVAALMLTFSPDHSAFLGLSIFGGFAVATALVMLLAAIIVQPSGQRWPAVIMAAISFVLGMTAGIPSIRTDALFFGLVIAWAASTGLVELIHGIRSKGADGARDAKLIGSLSILLAVLLAVVPVGFVQHYTTPQGEPASLTGIIIGVGMFGAYAAIVAVFLAIAGLTPGAKRIAATDAEKNAGTDDSLADNGGYA